MIEVLGPNDTPNEDDTMRGIMRETRPQPLCSRAKLHEGDNCHRCRRDDLTVWCRPCIDTLLRWMDPADGGMGDAVYPFINHAPSLDVIRSARPEWSAILDEVLADLRQMDADEIAHFGSLEAADEAVRKNTEARAARLAKSVV